MGKDTNPSKGSLSQKAPGSEVYQKKRWALLKALPAATASRRGKDTLEDQTLTALS